MDKKNTLLLTVIAIATLLVAVVGATFAFFTAQNAQDANTPVNVTTYTTNSSTFDQSKTITITADMSNFASTHVGETREEGTYGDSTPSVTLKAGSNTESAMMCYEVSFVVTDASDNKFSYSTANNENKPELVLHLEKKPGSDADGGTTSFTEITSIDELNYKTEIGESTDTTKETGFDITTANDYEYKIPTLASQGSEKQYKHKITVTGHDAEAKDEWKVRVVMINYNFDQEQNAGKTFTASIKFHQVDC